MNLSPSSLSVLRDCVRCYWFQEVKGVKRPRGIFPTLPGAIDRVIKTYCQPYRDKGELPPLLEGLPGLLRKKQAMKLTATFEGHKITGILDDAIDLPDGTIAAIDHKTRKDLPQAIHEAYLAQIMIYQWLLNAQGLPAADKGFLIFYAPLNGALHEGFPFETAVRQVDADHSIVEEVFHQAIACTQATVAPDPSPSCEYCAYVEKAHE